MELTLKLLTGRNAGQLIRIPAKKFFIGRADDCHLRPHSDLISRHHCALLIEGEVCAVRDFGSRNGTFVNDVAVEGQLVLNDGDRLKVAHLEFEVQLKSATAAPGAPAARSSASSQALASAKRPKVKDVKDAAQRTAAPVGAGGDDEISDWLSEEDADGDTRNMAGSDAQEPAQRRQAAHETPHIGAMSTQDTVFLNKVATEDTTATKPLEFKKPDPKKNPEAKPAEPPPAAESASGAGADEKAKEGLAAETAKRLFGKPLQATPKSPAKTSRDAAAEALKRFFNSRRT